MSERTPTPWRTIHQYIFSGDHAIPIASGHKEYATNPNGELYAQAQANAAFIVKAVNSHDTLVTELKLIADWRNVNMAGEYEHGLRDIIRSMLDCADRALASIKVPS